MSQYSNSVSFQAPTDYGIEQQAVDRQRKLAEAMMMRSQQPQQAGQMVGNRYVPQSWTQGLAQALQGPAAMYQQKQADEKAKDISTRQRAAYAAELEKFGGLMSGTPARSFETGANEMGDEAATQNVAAVPGDRRAALAMALQAQNPMLQQLGMQQMVKGMDAKWEKAELPNPDGTKRVGYVNMNSQNPLETFQAGGVAPVKLEGVNTGGNTTFVNPYAPKADGAPTVDATGNAYKDLLATGPDGKPVVNNPLLDAKKQIAQAGKSSTNVSVNTGQKGFDNTLKLRGDFRSEPIYKAHQEVQAAHSQITQALKLQSPAGDLAGATKIMKILDPGSVVRESELGMAMAASGALDRLQNYASNVINGTKLTPKQRIDFQNLADKLSAESAKQYNGKRSEYQGIAERNGLSVPDVLGAEQKMPGAPSPVAGGAFADPGKEQRYQEWLRSQGK